MLPRDGSIHPTAKAVDFLSQNIVNRASAPALFRKQLEPSMVWGACPLPSVCLDILICAPLAKPVRQESAKLSCVGANPTRCS